MQLRPGVGVTCVFDGLFDHSFIGTQCKGVVFRPHLASQITLEYLCQISAGLKD
ncbi:hypothetical protein D3C76_1696220 [compost metagenome]